LNRVHLKGNKLNVKCPMLAYSLCMWFPCIILSFRSTLDWNCCYYFPLLFPAFLICVFHIIYMDSQIYTEIKVAIHAYKVRFHIKQKNESGLYIIISNA
jgi:hypothetical protein